MPHPYPDPVRTDGSNAFARQSMAERLPGIFDEVLDRNPDYPPEIKKRVRALRDEIVNDAPMDLFDPPAPDHDLWARRFAPHEDETWLGTDWFFAETFAYRHLLAASDYWTTRRDPFRPYKEEELRSEALREVVGAALEVDGSRRELLGHRLLNCLWGNRMDLSMKGVLEQGTEAKDEHLLANDLPEVADHLLDGPPGPVHFLMDNAGTEEAFDLVLADLLLGHDLARRVILHVKMAPVLVSDVLGEDVFWLLDVIEDYEGPLRDLAERIWGHLRDGRLRIVPDFYWNADAPIREIPPRLEETFRDAQLVVSKGDANYRRITNDALWPPEATLADAAGPFPAPLLALRTLKSDTLVGVDPDTRARLDREEENWRTKGTYGVAQFAP
ncbi:MAG: damage-control phosphatase ARMT1 family protein [Salinibacter sp.]|uniref:damage-control phosphatase ARMT1 family protein n=1 Tax=Salinibacter sp. TaxID=2065818 RepID=UPI0035D471A7